MTDRPTERETRDALERFIDAWGCRIVVEMLAEICDEKSDHIRASYSNEALAKIWNQRAHRLARTAGNL